MATLRRDARPRAMAITRGTARGLSGPWSRASGARLDSDMSDKTAAAIEPQFPPEWRTASMRVPLRGYVLRLSWERPVLELLLLPPPDVAADASSSVPATRANTSWVPSSHLPPSLRVRLSARCARTGTTTQQHASTNSSARVVTLEPGKPIRVVCRDSASVEPPQWVPPHPGDGNQLSKSARLRKMHSPLSLAPRALGCVQHGTGLKGSMCTFSDVCVSPRDGILVPNTSRLDPGLRRLPFDPKSGWLLEGDPLPAVVEDRPAQDATSVSQRAQSAQRALIRVGQQLHGQLLAATRCERESVPSYAWLRRAFRCERRRHGERQSRCINSPLPPVPGGERCRRRMEVRTGGVANGSRGRGQLSSDHRSTRPRQLGHAELPSVLVSWRTHAFPCGLDGAAPPR